MNVLIVGACGQLGQELQTCIPADIDCTALTFKQLDISQAEVLENAINEHQPDWLLNAAAYTAVDKAESDIELAYRVNETGSRLLAEAAQKHHCRLIHISTDYVFDGSSPKPYSPEDATSPLGVYGESKLAGEEQIRKILGDSAIIARTAWVYSPLGHNFVKTMLRLMRDKPQLGVVADQIGTPTCTASIAKMMWACVQQNTAGGTYHWTDAGAASWYDFAVAIQRLGLQLGLLEKAIPIRPIRTEDYPTPAQRPTNSLLDSRTLYQQLEIEPIHWQAQLEQTLRRIQD